MLKTLRRAKESIGCRVRSNFALLKRISADCSDHSSGNALLVVSLKMARCIAVVLSALSPLGAEPPG
jgi:hypothetical protein